MRTDPQKMTVRLVPLRSHEAGDSRVGGSVAERVALVASLSAMLWARTGRPIPAYTRSTMPVTLTPLAGQSERA